MSINKVVYNMCTTFFIIKTIEMKLQTLYRKTKSGKVSYINLYTRKNNKEDVYTMYTETGIVGQESKAKTSKIEVKEGKNIGKKNETTVKQQAEKELLASHSKLFAKGYKINKQYVEDNKYNTFKDLSIMPMLLNKYGTSNKAFKPGFAQRKYDGVRNITEKHNDTLRLKSREGIIFDLGHILQSVSSIVSTQLDEPLDGELYKHNVPLQEITSMVKSNDPNEKLEYHIYDIPIPNMPFYQRRNLMLALDVSQYSNVFVDAGVPINSEEELEAFHKESLELGYEGTIFCDPDSLYDFSFRSSGKGKKKPRTTAEFKCIGHYWNKGKMSKQSTLICETKEGETFHVKLKGTGAQREKWAAEFDDKVDGQMITVEYRKLSNKKVPLEAVGVAIRDYE